MYRIVKYTLLFVTTDRINAFDEMYALYYHFNTPKNEKNRINELLVKFVKKKKINSIKFTEVLRLKKPENKRFTERLKEPLKKKKKEKNRKGRERKRTKKKEDVNL